MFGPQIWAAGRPDPVEMAGSPRGVRLHAFSRTERLFDADLPPQLASALALLAPLDRGAAPAAVIGSWAAVESLLVGPSDGANSVAAGRLALIVGASHLRAELTVLAWAHARTGADPLAASIAAAPENADKARLAHRAVAAGTPLVAARESDRWALERLRPLLADPRKGVADTQAVLARAFLRLYRQRNSIAHGGRSEGASLDTTIRVVAPLVGAGVDRMAQSLLDGGPTRRGLGRTEISSDQAHRESGRRESSSRSQLGKLPTCRRIVAAQRPFSFAGKGLRDLLMT